MNRAESENADLRARLEQAERERDEVREEMKEAAGELLIPLPQSDPTVRKLLLANSIMRQERDAARADLERTNAEAAAMRETLESAMAHIEAGICPHESTHRAGAIWEVCDACGARWADDEGGRKDEKEPEIIGVIEAALSGQAGADLLVEVRRLRQVERLALAYRDVFSERLQHVADNPLAPNGSSKWLQQAKDLLASEISALKSLFAALGKEAK